MKKFVLMLTLAVAFVSCRKESFEIVDPDRHYCYTYAAQFETIWTGIDQGYVFWSRETIDWDSVHDALLPVFKAFDANGGASDYELRAAYENMVRGLLDHHMYVQVKNLKTGHSVTVSPAWLNHAVREDFHPDYVHQQVAMLSSMEGVTEYKEGHSDFPCYFALFPGNGDKKIAYLRFESFSVSSTVAAVQSGYLPQSALAPLRAFYGTDVLGGVTNGWAADPSVEAVILDVRGNGGGNLSDLTPLVCSLNPTSLDYGYSRVKEGLGRLDYSEWTPFILNSPVNHLNGDKKVVVLADCNSASCSELTASLVQLMPQGTFIGERTYGATCPLLPGGHDILYSGVFGDYDTYGYYVYTSNFDVVTKEYKSLEGIGVTPDIECPLDINAVIEGRDNQLERALQFIRTGK